MSCILGRALRNIPMRFRGAIRNFGGDHGVSLSYHYIRYYHYSISYYCILLIIVHCH